MHSALRCLCSAVARRHGMATRVWSRSLHVTAPRMKELEENPFYDKYKLKLDEVREPMKEKISRFREGKGRTKDGGNQGRRSTPMQSPYSYTQQPRLDSVMKMDLIADKTSEEISKIWVDYHKTKDCIGAVMTSEQYTELSTKAALAPMFVYPLPRDEGYEFFLSQFNGNCCYFTSLINYQMYQTNAPICLTLTHYTDLQDSKGIVLMLGEVDTNALSTIEAQFLANQIQLYYGTQQSERFALVKQFNHDPQNFDYNSVLTQLENSHIKRETDDTQTAN